MIFIIILVNVAILDIAVKNLIEKHYTKKDSRYIPGGLVKIHRCENKGCFLGFMNKRAGMVRVISVVITLLCLLLLLIILPKKGMSVKKLGLALVLGGAISNEYDRIKKGSVTDYFSINLPFLKNVVFNLGDISIFAGVILLVLGTKEQPR